MERERSWVAAVSAALFLLSIVGPASAQYTTVGGSDGAVCQFAFYHYDEDADVFRQTLDDQGIARPSYNELVISAPYTTPEPPTGSPTVQSFLALVERSPDVLLISSHGDESGNYLLVEGYSSAELRNERLQDLEEQYSGWLDSFSIVDDPDYEVDVWGIAVHRGLCTYDFDNDRAIVFAGFCHGGDWLDAWGAGAAVGYTGSEFTWHSAIDTFFVRLNGERGREKRCTGEALPDEFVLAGSPDIVLSPAVEEMYPSHHTVLDGEFTGGYVQFDTAIEVEGPLDEAIRSVGLEHYDPDPIEVDDIVLVGDSRLEFTLRPAKKGSAAVFVESTAVRGWNSDRYLDGNTNPTRWDGYWYGPNARGPSPDDYSTPYISTVGDNPAAAVHGFSVTDRGLARWKVSSEYRTSHYRIDAAPSPGGPWESLVPSLPAGPGFHEVELGRPQHVWYRLTEVEHSGHEITHGVATPGRPVGRSEEERPDVETLRERIDALNRRREAEGWGRWLARTGEGDTLVAYCPDALSQAVQSAILSFWEGCCGYNTEIVTIDTFPDDPEAFRSYLKGDIAARASEGAGYFLLVGDANDWQWFDLEEQGSEYWVGEWAGIRDYYIASGYPEQGQPEHDVIPTFVVADTMPRSCNTGWLTPYWMTDQPYQDVDDDGLPDVVLTRLPFTEPWEVLTFGEKMQQNEVGRYGPDQVSFFVGDLDHDAFGDGAEALAALAAVKAELPPEVITRHLYESNVPSDPARNDSAAAHWNSYHPELLMMLSSYSNRSWPAYFFDQTDEINPWSMSMLVDDDVTNATPVFAGSCDAADFARTEDPDYGRPIVERFLTAYWKGSIAWMGPSVGSWQAGNRVLGTRFVRELYRDPERPLAEIFLQAVRDALVDHEGESDIVSTVRSYGFLGDPLSRLNKYEMLTGVGDGGAQRLLRLELLPNQPNPFNPSTTIRFTTAREGPVELSVYNLQGRLVTRLVDEVLPPGRHTAHWNGREEGGEAVGSGVYFCRLRAGGRTLTRKMALVK